MTDFIKKNKIQISKTRKQLEDDLRNIYVSSVNTKFVGTFSMRVKDFSRNEAYKDLSILVGVYVKNIEITVLETKGKLCFCMNTDGLALKKYILDSGFYRSTLSAITDGEERNGALIELFRKYELFADIYGRSIDDWKNAVKKSEVMKHFEKDIFNVIPTLDCTFRVDDAYPFMSDNSLLPLLVYNVSNGEGWYIMTNDEHDFSYRRNRNTVMFGDDIRKRNLGRKGIIIPRGPLVANVCGESREIGGLI